MPKPRDRRQYVQVSVSLPTSKKFGNIDDPRAGWLYIVGLCHAGAELTDGIIPPRLIERMAGVPARWTKALIDAEMWHEAGHACNRCPQPPAGRIVIHDYLLHQRSRADVEKSRDDAASAATSRWQARDDADSNANSMRTASETDANGMPFASPPHQKGNATIEVEIEKDSSDEESCFVGDRRDVDRICDHLAAAIEANGSRRPRVGKTWHEAGRLLLDRDQRTEAQVHAAIDWCQASTFWRANVMSMPKLREKYDQLRLQAIADQAKSRPAADRGSTADQRVAAADSLRDKFAAMDAAEAEGRPGLSATPAQLAIGGQS